MQLTRARRANTFPGEPESHELVDLLCPGQQELVPSPRAKPRTILSLFERSIFFLLQVLATRFVGILMNQMSTLEGEGERMVIVFNYFDTGKKSCLITHSRLLAMR